MSFQYEDILIVKPCCIGDLVMALPAIEALAASTPHGRVDIAVGQHSSAVVAGRRDIGEILSTDDVPGTRGALGIARQARSYDAVAILDRSRLLRYSMTSGGRVASVRDLEDHHSRHETDIYLDVACELGARPQSTIPALEFSSSVRAEASSLLEHLPDRFLAIHPGGAENPGTSMAEKRWPIERYVELCRWADRNDVDIVVTGGPNDSQIVDLLTDHGEVSERIHSLAGRASLMASAFVASRSLLYVGSDTGMTHLAAAGGAPTIAIFGPTNPNRYAPRGPTVRVLAPSEAWEQPDRDLRRSRSSITLARTEDVSLDEVIASADELLVRMEAT